MGERLLLEKTMQMEDIVQIRTSFLRSIDIERDITAYNPIENYTFTLNSHNILKRILGGLNNAFRSQAWTMTGPYGTGKSSFGLFLVRLLCNMPHDLGNNLAFAKLQSEDPVLASEIESIVYRQGKQGFLPVLITGGRQPIAHALIKGFHRALSSSLRDEPLLERADALLLRAESGELLDNRATIKWIADIVHHIANNSTDYSGILVVFDELGKALEYTGLRAREDDIFILQELAELANRSKETPLLFLGILHQAFERYVVSINQTSRYEWLKVQGRFEDIAFQEAPDQMLRLLAGAIRHTDAAIMELLRPILVQTALEALNLRLCPPSIGSDEFIDLAVNAFPLHPTAFVALPHIFNRFAQNERSLFAYLSSMEPFGFQEYISSTELTVTNPLFIGLRNVFDYISSNLRSQLQFNLLSKRIKESIEAIDRVSGLADEEVAIIKTIGILSFLNQVSFIKPEPQLISYATGYHIDSSHLLKKLDILRKRSVIVYRRFNNTYRVWGGSDLDPEELLVSARRKVTGTVSVADTIQKYLPPRPLVAKQNSYHTGILRLFQLVYLDTPQDFDLNHGNASQLAYACGIVVYCLPVTVSAIDDFNAWAQGPSMAERHDIVIAIPKQPTRLQELLIELKSVYWIKENIAELQGDRIAQRELQERLAEIQRLITSELDHFIGQHGSSSGTYCTWFWKGREIPPGGRSFLSHLLSEVAQSLYPKSPRIWNELINRRTLSSNAMAARRNLIEAMLTHACSERLGIQGFPPELAMYESVLRASNIHKELKSGIFGFAKPGNADLCNINPCWERLEQIILDGSLEPTVVSDILSDLCGPPYGLAVGTFPVLLCAFILANCNETTFYKEGTFIPEPNISDWEILLRRPELFSIGGSRVSGGRLVVVQRMARGLDTAPLLVPVVRQLIQAVRNLPEYAWRTNRLSPNTLLVRKSLACGQSPEKLLFNDLPLALGFEPFTDRPPDGSYVEDFFRELNNALKELAEASSKLINSSREALLDSCGIPRGESSWQELRKRASLIYNRVSNPTLLAFLNKVNDEYSSVSANVESVLSFLMKRPVHHWLDADAGNFLSQVRDIGEQFGVAYQNRLTFNESDLTEDERRHSIDIAEKLLIKLKSIAPVDLSTRILRASLTYLLHRRDSD